MHLLGPILSSEKSWSKHLETLDNITVIIFSYLDVKITAENTDVDLLGKILNRHNITIFYQSKLLVHNYRFQTNFYFKTCLRKCNFSPARTRHLRAPQMLENYVVIFLTIVYKYIVIRFV